MNLSNDYETHPAFCRPRKLPHRNLAIWAHSNGPWCRGEHTLFRVVQSPAPHFLVCILGKTGALAKPQGPRVHPEGGGVAPQWRVQGLPPAACEEGAALPVFPVSPPARPHSFGAQPGCVLLFASFI